MSEDTQAPPTDAAVPVEFAPENQAPATTTEPAQPIKTDVDELVELFSQHSGREVALKAMRDGSTGEGKDKRFSANGKSYSIANCRKAINRVDEKGLFKGQTQQQEAKEGTFKEDAPLVSQHVPIASEPQEIRDIDAEKASCGGGTSFREESNLGFPPVTPPPAIEPTIEQQLTEGPQTFAEIDPKASKKNGKLVQGFCKVLADYYNEPSVNVTNDDATEYGEDLAMLFPDLAKPKNSAAAHLIGGLILPRGLILAPKIKGTVDGLFGKKPQVKAA